MQFLFFIVAVLWVKQQKIILCYIERASHLLSLTSNFLLCKTTVLQWIPIIFASGLKFA